MYSMTPISMVKGDLVTLRTTDSRHIGAEAAASENLPRSFGQLLFDGIQEVNTFQNEASALSVAAVTNPDEINAHEVTIAIAKANMSLSIAQAVLERLIQGYETLTNLR